MSKKKYSTICFTSYLPEEETSKVLHEDGCKWYCWGIEICPATGRQHLQGMANHKKTSCWSSTKRKMHIEKCMDPIKSLEYCQKDGKFFEWGTRPVFDKILRALKTKDVIKLTKEEMEELSFKDYNAATKTRQLY